MIGMLTPDWPAPPQVCAYATTREGGLSRGVYASANLGDHVEDDPALVTANRQALRTQLPGQPRLAWMSQVHSATVVPAQPELVPVADAQFTSELGVACTVLTADCLPVLFCDRAGTRVAAAHAGWRGLAAGVLEATVSALGVEPADILAWLGPAIGPAAFEVGPEVREAFLAGPGDPRDLAAAFGAGRGDRWHADMERLARARLAACGVQAVYGGGVCTVSEPQRFFSYRRDGICGRQASLIYLQPR